MDDSKWGPTIQGLAQVRQYLTGTGIDVGCGTARVHPDIPAVDQSREHSHADTIHDCKDLEFLPEASQDFIFSSHCLEDFENIPEVFRAWWTRLKKGGLMVLLLPDIEGGRYPRAGQPGANPSHHTDVGPAWLLAMLRKSGLAHEIVQIDTVPHDSSCTFDAVIRRLA
jgi:predicted SAM-dependent methyltransferase